MANRFWVGGNDNWNATAGTKWATTSGGAGGAAVPTSADDVFLDNGAGTGNVTITATANCKSLTCTGYVGTLAGSSSLTIAGAVTLVAGMTLTYSGTMTVNTTATLTSNGKTFSGNLSFAGNTQTYTLADDWTITGTTAFPGTSTITINSNNIYANGNITISTASVLGTTKLIASGAGTISGSSTGVMRLNFDINATGAIVISGTIRYGTNTLKYVTASSVTTTGSTLALSLSPTIDTNGITWADINTSGTFATLTLTSNLTCSGSFTNTTQYAIATSNLIVGGSFTNGSGSLINASTGSIILNGTGTLSCNGAANYIAANLTINTSGTITLGTTISYRTGTFTYTAGTVATGTGVLSIGAAATLNTNGMTFHSVSCTGTTTITNNSLLTIEDTITYEASSTITFTGTHGWTAANFVIATAGGISHILTAALTYTVTTSFTSVTTTNAIKDTLASSSGTVKAIFTLNFGATQNVAYTNATRIDSSGGQTIYSFNGTLTDTINWQVLNASLIGSGVSTFVN